MAGGGVIMRIVYYRRSDGERGEGLVGMDYDCRRVKGLDLGLDNPDVLDVRWYPETSLRFQGD